MTGFPDIKNTDEAFDLGADGFLPKPFKFDDLLKTIMNVLGNLVGNKLVYEPTDFMPIPVSTLLSDCEIPFHIFMKMSSTKFIRIAYSGEDLSDDRLNSYKSRGIKELYLHKDDHARFLGFSLDITSGVMSDQKIPIKKKKSFIKAMGESLFSHVSFEPKDNEEVKAVGEFISMATTALIQDDDIFSSLNHMMESQDYLYSHSLSVSVLSVLFAKRLGWKKPADLFNISMGGLLHDTGKTTWDDKTDSRSC